jgi:hypothetical protein
MRVKGGWDQRHQKQLKNEECAERIQSEAFLKS